MNPETLSTAAKGNEQLPVPTKRMLLVDDNDSLRIMLHRVVQSWSFAASMAATVEQAQNIVLTEEPFAVIVSDYDLPDGNGLEFLDWLKRKMRIHVPFLLISGGEVPAHPATEDYQFLAKPFGMEQLRRRMEELGCLELQPADSYRLSPLQAAAASVYARIRPPKDK